MKNGFAIFASIVAGLWLLSNPGCNRGCRTVAEHFIEHGIADLLAGLS